MASLKQFLKFAAISFIWLSYLACSPSPQNECSTDDDCKEKGTHYICSLDKTKDIKVCKLQLPSNDCETDKDCRKKGADYVCRFDSKTQKKRCILNETCPTTCLTDSDCLACKDGRTSCVSGRCAKKETPKCPSSCQKDEDCQACPDGKTSCLDGRCQKAPKCPSSCQKDEDCQACSDGKIACRQGQCSKPLMCKDPCRSDDDCQECSDGRTQCRAHKCIKPLICKDPCQNDADCKDCRFNKTTCLAGKCVTPPDCKQHCLDDRDCALCSDGKNKCQNGVCAKPLICKAICQSDDDCKDCPDDRHVCRKAKCSKPLACKQNCQDDDDCALCSGGKNKCQVGKCTKPLMCKTPCQSDADCRDCPKERTQCRGGQCIKPPACKKVCVDDIDCALCSDGKNKCQAGKCIKPPSCKTVCVDDIDCALCSNNRTKCQKGKCTKPPVCKAVCVTKADCIDCPDGKNVCRQGKCSKPLICKSPCSTDADCVDCSGGKTKCLKGICSKPPQCLASCNDNQDCALCGKGFSCIKHLCQIPTPVGGPGAECNPNATNPCLPNHFCIQVSSNKKSYCFQDCTKNPTVCSQNTTDGRTTCQPFARDSQNNIISVCLKIAKKGEYCSLIGKGQSVCKNQKNPYLLCWSTKKCTEIFVQKKVNDKCNQPDEKLQTLYICDPQLQLTCVKGKCQKIQLAQKYEKCGVGAIRCAANLTCVALTSGASHGYCLESCDPKNPHCPQKAACLPLSNGGGVCQLLGTQPQYALCGGQLPDAPKLDLTKLCQAGYSCTISHPGDSRGLCLKTVTTCNASSCAPPYKCQTLSSGEAACLKECSNNSSLCQNPRTCLTYPPKNSKKYCILPPPTGPNAFGKSCKVPFDHFGCQKGLECLITNKNHSGFCSRTCSPSKPCPSYTENGKTFKAKCLALRSQSYCVFSCANSSKDCPSGYSCTTLTTNDKVCLIP